ncbi:MAG: DUF4124 domain-containing protein [Haliea sp.]|uniref:DUF4124 domain-containing protein n=1 Tax=Haliea sp. TaxID=1932666 RepID=UPI0032EF900F
MLLRLLFSGVLAFACAAAAAPTTVYRTVDEQGVVSFSDQPPADPAAAEVIAVNPPQAAPAAESLQQLEAMRETTERMAADRREREAQRAAARERQSDSTAAAEQHRASPEVRYEYLYLPSRVPFRPWRAGPYPPHRPYPVPQRPAPEGAGIKARGPPANSQLMRPILPRDRD